MSRSPKRPNTLPVRSSLRDQVSINNVSLSWLEFMPRVTSRRVLAIIQGQDTARGVRKSKYIYVLVLFTVFVVLMMYNLPERSLEGEQSSVCDDEWAVYVDGRRVCDRRTGMKYLTYQPPGGGWNNQRIAFENAVIIAKLLGRALLVHPLVPHQEILRIKKLHNFALSYEVYNEVPTDKLLPLSKVIDLSRLSRLLPVKEITTNHTQFIKDYQHLSWYRVCHNALLGYWLDSLPKKNELQSWKALRTYAAKKRRDFDSIPAYRRSCKNDTMKYSHMDETTPFWGVIDELSQCTDDVIYFEEGSMFFRQMLFLNKQRTLDSHRWIIRYVAFAPPIWTRLELITRTIGYPFNAMHVRRTDHPTSQNVNQTHWLDLLRKREMLDITTKLYVATDEKNLTWFDPFRKAGLELLFAHDFQERLESTGYVNSQDVLGLTEQLICAHASKFVGSYYSTFSLYIKRLRKQMSWKGGLLPEPYSIVTWVDRDTTV